MSALCLLRVHKGSTPRSHKGPGLCGWVSCACLDPLIGPDSLTLPSLLGILLFLLLLDYVWEETLEEKPRQ